MGPKTTSKKIAVIVHITCNYIHHKGSGIAGMSAAWLLSQESSVPGLEFETTLFESEAKLGGHTNTVQIESLPHIEPKQYTGVDTGFIVCNPVTYPNFLAFCKALGVELLLSDMSFSVSRNGGEFEWAGEGLSSVFVQRQNILPFGTGFSVWRMIVEIHLFHKEANEIAEQSDRAQFNDDGTLKEEITISPFASMTLAEFFNERNYSAFFYENYLLPMTASIWSAPAGVTFDTFPLLTLVRFMRNHVMLQFGGRPLWLTVKGGSREYINKLEPSLKDIRLNSAATSIKRETVNNEIKVFVTTQDGREEIFDHVILACHSDQSLTFLADPTATETELLSEIKYTKNHAVLHRDISLMPVKRGAWSSWNYLTKTLKEIKSQSMCLTYWMNRLQTFINPEIFGQVFVTLNPIVEIDKTKIMGEYEYTHPVYSPSSIKAQDRLNEIQNVNGVTFCGAWTNYGFHEDGVTSGLIAAVSIGAKCPFEIALNGGYPTHRNTPQPPNWAVKMGVEKYIPVKAVYVPWVKKGLGEKWLYGLFVLGIVTGFYFNMK